MAFTILHDGAEIPPSGTPAPAPNTYEITAASSPVPNAEFPLSIQWKSEGVDIGEPNVRVLNFIAALDQFLVSRGTGEQSNVITVRKLTVPPPPPIPNPYYLDTILQTSVTTEELIDVSPLANALSKAGSGGGPAYTAADPLFGGPVYDLSDTTHRVLLPSGDGFIASNFAADEWTAEWQIKGVGPGASGNFLALSAISFGLWVSGFDIAFNVSNIGGGSFSVGGATLNPAQFDHVVLQRNNTADPTFGFLELGLNGVRVGVSTTFLKTHPINSGAGFAMVLGYFTIGARMKANEIRFVKNQRVYTMSLDYATPVAYTPQTAPHPVGPWL